MLDNIGNWLTPSILKRIADLLEKIAAASFIWCAFQQVFIAFVVFVICTFFELVFNQKDRKMTGLDLCLLLSVLFLGGLGILGARYNAKRHEKEA